MMFPGGENLAEQWLVGADTFNTVCAEFCSPEDTEFRSAVAAPQILRFQGALSKGKSMGFWGLHSPSLLPYGLIFVGPMALPWRAPAAQHSLEDRQELWTPAVWCHLHSGNLV